MTDFILASASPRRKFLLESMDIPFRVVVPDVDESVLLDESPEDYVLRLSIAKAQVVAEGLTINAIILAADTTVIHNGDILGKPADEDEARRMLLRLRGDTHRVCTGFTLMRTAEGVLGDRHSEVVCTEVKMRMYAASEMERWIKSGQAFDKAGGYAIQSMGFPAVEEVEGSYNNVVGLPTEALTEALKRMGYGTPPANLN